MPDNPSNWVNALPPWLGGALMAFFMAVVRVIYDKEETSAVRILMEAFICGSLTVSAGSAFAAMGYGQNWYLFCGGMIGMLGSQTLRAFAKKFINKKIP